MDMNDKKITMDNGHIENLQIRQDEITMIESLLPLILLISICLLPIHIVFLIGLFIYLLLFIMEICLKRITPICILVLFIFFLLFTLYFIFNQRWFLFYVGSFFYFPLAIITVVLLIAKRPFTIYYSGGKGMVSLHYTISMMWAIIYVVSAIVSMLLIPNPAFIYVPFLLVIIGISGFIFLNFFYFGHSNNRKREFNIGQYCFKEIQGLDQNYEDFYSLASQEIWSTIIQSKQKVIQSQNELKETMKISDKDYEDQIVRFIAYNNDKPVGTISCVMDGHSGLPIERDTKINIDPVRRLGRVMEIGHFTINSSFRFRPDMFIGLFKAAIDFALERDITFILNCPYEHSVSMYQKIGFIKISKEPIADTIIGANVCVLILNLARMLYNNNKEFSDTYRQQLTPLLNQFLMERHYKRQVIMNIFKRNKRKQYNFMEDEFVSNIFNNKRRRT